MFALSLSRASLAETDLTGASLLFAGLSGANLRGADLSGADLSSANLSRADLRGALLTGARFRNRHHGVTGVLLYEAGHFAQVLEGPTDVVNRLLTNLVKDARHRDFNIISQSEVDERYFVGWDMDWRELSLFTDASHRQLRDLLRSRSIGDRDVIYKALSTFLTDLARSAMPDAPARRSWLW